MTRAELKTQPQNALTRHRPTLHALTGLRFFLAAYVVVHHTRTGLYLVSRGHTYAGTFFYNGNVAVAEFFLLSGFILAYTYRGQIETTPGGRTRFWQARFARIWPVYALSLVISSIILHSTPTPWLAAASLFMVQGWDPMNIMYAGVWNAVCWTLSVEAFFYVLFPPVQKLVRKLETRRLQLAIALLLLAIVFLNTAAKGPGHPGYVGVFAYVPYPAIHLPEFLLGVAAGNVFLIRGTKAPSTQWMTYAGLIIAVGVLMFPAARWTSFVMLGFALMTYGLAAERTWLSRLLSTRALLLGGGLSYSMYLLQTPIRDALESFPAHSRLTSSIAGKGILFLALVLIPLLVFLFFEEPSRRFLRKRFDALDRQRAPTR